MSFFSFNFLLFLIILFVVYYFIPVKFRYIWLLVGSYCFYATWNPSYALILLGISVSSYVFGLFIHKYKKKFLLWLGIIISLGVLCIFKFWLFWSFALYALFGLADPENVDALNIIAPIGLSFFTLESVAYLVDIYNDKSLPEKNFFKLALFFSFFPKILSGPIERSDSFLKQISSYNEKFNYDKVKHGLLLMLWGYFLKMALVERISPLVDESFGNYSSLCGFTLIIALLLYGIQIYADFAGYSIIAVGIAECFGYSLINNFRQPYFSPNINSFWKRWHISLSEWLKDYIYIPLGGNREGEIRKTINLFVTFFVSGVWHGTGLNFIVWGLIHGFYQAVWSVFIKIRAKKKTEGKKEEKVISFKYILSVLITFVLVDFAWLFFRAPSLELAIKYLKKIFFELNFLESVRTGEFLLTDDYINLIFILINIIILFIVDLYHENKKSFTILLNALNVFPRWIIYLFSVIILLFAVIYNYGTDVSSFIYANF